MLDLTYTSDQHTGTANTTYTINAGHNAHSILVIKNGLILNQQSNSLMVQHLQLNSSSSTSDMIDIRYMYV